MKQIKVCTRCGNDKFSKEDHFCSLCGMNLIKPKLVYDLLPVLNEMLAVLAKHEVLMSSLDRVLEQLKEHAYTSTRIQEIWVNYEYPDRHVIGEQNLSDYDSLNDYSDDQQ